MMRARALPGTRSISYGFIVTVVALAAAFPAPAFATCGSAQCFLVTDSSQGLSNKGVIRFDVSFQSIEQSKRLDGSDSTSDVLTPKIDFENRTIEERHHREVRTQNAMMKAALDVGLTDRLTFSAIVPFFNRRDHEHFDDAGTPGESFTRQDGTTGFGDVEVGLRYGLVVGARNLLIGAVMLKTPTGTYRLHDSEGAINEPSIQPGTGSYDLTGSLNYRRQLVSEKAEWFVAGAYRANGKNDLDYRMGDEAQAHAGFSRRLGLRAKWQAQINVRRRGRDEYIGEKIHSTGNTYVNFSPGISFTSREGTRLYGFVQVPVHQNVNEQQLAPRTAILFGISRSFE